MLAAGGYAWWQLAPPAHQSPGTQASPAAPKPAPVTITPPQPPAESAAPGQPLSAEPASPAPTSHSADGATLRLMATEPTWVSVSSQGKTLFVGLMSRDESRDIEGVERAKLLVGNAGGLEVSWRGEPVGPLGPRGRTRIVWLRPEGVEIALPGS
jgi:cytoskeleton protein RodZ